MADLASQRSDTPPAPRAGRFEILGAWLHVWTPPRGTVVPPVPWGKVAAGAALAALALTGLGLWLVPQIEQSKRSQSRAAAREAAILAAAERQRLTADQRLHRARATGLPPSTTAAGLRRRAVAVVAALEASITDDARARVRAGTLQGPILATRCHPYTGGVAPRQPVAPSPSITKYACTVVTGAVRSGPTGSGVTVSVGYPFWARVDVRRGRYLWCKINPRPGEQAVGLSAGSVPLPPPCDLTTG